MNFKKIENLWNEGHKKEALEALRYSMEYELRQKQVKLEW